MSDQNDYTIPILAPHTIESTACPSNILTLCTVPSFDDIGLNPDVTVFEEANEETNDNVTTYEASWVQ